jgi:hypothetical protein
MIEIPKLVFILIVGFAVWYAYRWINGPRRERELPRRRPAPPPPPKLEAEDLTACRTCGAYVAAGARSCGRADCPYPR